MAEPILKWAGGKRQLLDDIKARFPMEYNNYHEPFFGGGAVFFELEPADGTINDLNARLMNFYVQVRDNHEELIGVSKTFQDPEADPDPDRQFAEKDRRGRKVSQYYYQQREIFNNRPAGDDFDALEEAALLLYLNRTGFNGLYRENRSGLFNVPIGRYANPDWVREEQIRDASAVLDETRIRVGDFDYILEVAEPGDLVYFDPPYEPMSATASFNDYSGDGFDRSDQERLLKVAKSLSEDDVWVVLSNSGVMFDLYDDAGFYVDIIGATRAINSDASGRGEVDEILATNVPPDERRPEQQPTLDTFSK